MGAIISFGRCKDVNIKQLCSSGIHKHNLYAWLISKMYEKFQLYGHGLYICTLKHARELKLAMSVLM